jgi:CBS domain-containing protein
MNARAAWRLERLGFGRVYRYGPGKADWRAAGLPMVRSAAPSAAALDVARHDAPTCRPDELVAIAGERTRGAGWETCVVVNDGGVVLGRLRGEAWRDGTRVTEEVMEEGPTTIRADEDLTGLVARMARRNVSEIIVTDPDGRLLGVLRRHDAEAMLRDASA